MHRSINSLDTMSAEKFGEITATILAILLVIYAVRWNRRKKEKDE